MKNYDLLFFKTGQQYIKSAIYLMKAICRSGNQTGAIADTMEEAVKITNRKVELSDLTLLLPALFDYYHGFELYIKGLIYLYSKKIPHQHEINELIENLNKECDNKKLLSLINTLYDENEGMIRKYKEKNNISDQSRLYESLRYPIDKSGCKFNYDDLRYNGKDGIVELKKTIKRLKQLNKLIVSEYYKNKEAS